MATLYVNYITCFGFWWALFQQVYLKIRACLRPWGQRSHSLMEHQACTASSVPKHCREEATLIIPVKVAIAFAEGRHATALVRSMEWSYLH
jgi:hypothetical protein